MKLPILIKDESGCLEVYSTTEDAVSYMEAMDVNEGIYSGYDCEGRVLGITTNEKDEIQFQESNIYEPEELRKSLIFTFENIESYKTKKNLANMSLGELVAELKRLKVISDNATIFGSLKRNILNFFKK